MFVKGYRLQVFESLHISIKHKEHALYDKHMVGPFEYNKEKMARRSTNPIP
jgi:hypothetical protein